MGCLHWFSLNFVGSDMFRVSQKLKTLKKLIREFSRSNYSDLEKRVKEAHGNLVELQNYMLSGPNGLNVDLEIEAHRKWMHLVRAEESFFCQKSRTTWLREGDFNTSYFHIMACSKQAINHMHFLVDEAGQRIESQLEIQDHCVDYFGNLLGSEEHEALFIQEDISSLLDFRCSQAHQSTLEAMFSADEIKDAFFTLPRNKCSGSNGFPAEFFTGCWSVVGGEVVSAVGEFFRSGKLLKQWNATTLALIPKIRNAASTSNFWPISCLNTVYKVIAKLLANRLKSVLPSVISHS